MFFNIHNSLYHIFTICQADNVFLLFENYLNHTEGVSTMNTTMNTRYIVYFPQSETYLFSSRTRVKSIEVAKKYSNSDVAKQAVKKSLWKNEEYTVLKYNA